MDKRKNCSSGAISPLFHDSLNIYILCKGVKLHMNFGHLVVRIFLSSGNLICRSTGISESPLEFEITRVDCIYNS